MLRTDSEERVMASVRAMTREQGPLAVFAFEISQNDYFVEQHVHSLVLKMV